MKVVFQGKLLRASLGSSRRFAEILKYDTLNPKQYPNKLNSNHKYLRRRDSRPGSARVVSRPSPKSYGRLSEYLNMGRLPAMGRNGDKSYGTGENRGACDSFSGLNNNQKINYSKPPSKGEGKRFSLSL
jgi:hypothetical protein